MKLLVAVKRVVDYNARIRVKADQVGVVFQDARHLSNWWSEQQVLVIQAVSDTSHMCCRQELSWRTSK